MLVHLILIPELARKYSQSILPSGEMFIGNAEIRYSHCAERHRRHFQEGVYSTYERAMRLGTIPEERMKLQL